MLLNHNFHTLNAKVSFAQVVGSSSDEEFSEFQTVLNNESIVNWTNESACEYDGFSIFSLNSVSFGYLLLVIIYSYCYSMKDLVFGRGSG